METTQPMPVALGDSPCSPCASRPTSWAARAWRSVKHAAREAMLYGTGSGASKLRQYEALREMDPRMLRDMGLDIGDVMRGCPKSGTNNPPGV